MIRNYLSIKTFENAKIVDIKLDNSELIKFSTKLSKTIRQAENVRSDSPLYRKKGNEKNTKKNKTKRAHALKGYQISYNVEILKVVINRAIWCTFYRLQGN